MSDELPAVELRGISKRFGAFVANSEVSLSAARGSVHAVVGENGAGKSTAMKMLYGMMAPDAGEIRVHGVPWGGVGRPWRGSHEAIASGIGMVHQHFMLAGPYTALENVVCGAETARSGTRWLPRALRPMDLRHARARLKALAASYGLEVPWDEPVENLPVGVQQRIEILKLLYRDASVLILDEPTAVLTPQETDALFDNLRKLKALGKTILIITHKLREVMALSDDVTVLRAGRVVGCLKAAQSTPAELAALMVGRKISLRVEAPPAPEPGPAVLEVSQLLAGVSFEVRAGEIVGIAGIEGNGQSELLSLITQPARLAAKNTGWVRMLGLRTLEGRAAVAASRVRELALAVVPEDRHRDGLLLERPVSENFLLGLQRRAPFSRHGFLSPRRIGLSVGQALEEYDVRPRSQQRAVGRLSGGNQQKLIIARELERRPRLIIAAQPTRGVDVGAIEFIHGRLFHARGEGAGVLLVSSELDEILTLSDRILVMYAGRVVACYGRGQATEQQLGLAMGGGA